MGAHDEDLPSIDGMDLADAIVAPERSRNGVGGVKAWVVEARGDAERTVGRTHTVSFSLRPKHVATGGVLEIGSPSPRDASSLAGEA
jgi:hypothetical protein